MPAPSRVLAALLATSFTLSGAGAPLGAQALAGMGASGSSPLTPRVVYGRVTAREGSGEPSHEWLAGVVLWRGQPGWHAWKPTPVAESRALRQRAMAVRDSLEDVGGESGLSPLCSTDGARVHCFATSSRDRALYVLDQRFRLPGRDSLVVVMVDRIDEVGGPPHVIGSIVIPVDLTLAMQQKMWQNGDTTFIVRPRAAENAIPDFLRRHPRLEFFLNEPVRGPGGNGPR